MFEPKEGAAETQIAVVGMACYFPDAATPEQFWENIANAVESVRYYTDQELRDAGVSDRELKDPSYVRAGVPLVGFDVFDPGFFGLNPREAAVMDPQHRLFLECGWRALEHAGHTPKSADGQIGVFAGSGMHWYLLRNVMTRRKLVDEMGEFLIRHTANDKDFLATRLSYHLDLRGPSLNVQTACSTSLVAIHLACQSLLNGDCDMALAGGSTVEVPHHHGYWYREEEVRSVDGHCRPFDESSTGTVFGSGCGVVCLRPLTDALEDGDAVHAVILGSAINNDGAMKVGYLAPSVDGQADAIDEALAIAEVDAESISYVETHGTATKIGDPIEIAALTQAFGDTERKQYCGIGSVKSNIGHLDTAAGVASFIKVVEALKHKQLPPSLHYRKPNPEIEFAETPFYVNPELKDWTPVGGVPRRAGVSSLGVGGTNAHVVLEEAPPQSSSAQSTAPHTLLLSAKSEAAVLAQVANLSEFLRENPAVSMNDVAFTLREGRVEFEYRTCVAASRPDEAVRMLTKSPEIVRANSVSGVVFLFPGQGAQYPNMSRSLYERDAEYRNELDQCFKILKDLGRPDVVDALFPAEGEEGKAEPQLQETQITQPALFCIEYALAKVLMTRGIQPQAMIGHSLGEYVAAALAGVFTLRMALKLVCARGQLVAKLPKGAMLAVGLSVEEAKAYTDRRVALAGANAPEVSVLSGDEEAISRVEEKLKESGVFSRRLQTSHAFHSSMLDSVLDSFRQQIASAGPTKPDRPFLSNLTGTWITDEQACDPDYWVRHMRETVKFHDGIRTILENTAPVFLEVGPGQTLAQLARQCSGDTGVATSVTLQPPKTVDSDDALVFCSVAGRLWALGLSIDWNAWGEPLKARRIPLPTYPFERQKLWIEPSAVQTGDLEDDFERLPFEKWFYQPCWKPLPLTVQKRDVGDLLLFRREHPLEGQFELLARDSGSRVVTVMPGVRFERTDEFSFRIDPGQPEHFTQLLDEVSPDCIRSLVYLWCLSDSHDTDSYRFSFESLLNLAKAWEQSAWSENECRWMTATANAQVVGGEQRVNPEHSLMAGPVRVIPQEMPDISCRWVDLSLNDGGNEFAPLLASQLFAELQHDASDETIAYRGRTRYVTDFVRASIDATTLEDREKSEVECGIVDASRALRKQGAYLITGAFGGVGRVLSEWLAQKYGARLLLATRKELPPRGTWESFLQKSQPGDPLRSIIRFVQRLEHLGALVEPLHLPNDGTGLAERVRQAGFDCLHGVFHLAGGLDDRLIGLKSLQSAQQVIQAKTELARDLEEVVDELQPGFMLYFSSLSAFAGVSGQIDYTAANAFLDCHAAWRNQNSLTRHIAVDWSVWRDAGMAASLAGKMGFAAQVPADSEPTLHPVLTHYRSTSGRHTFFGLVTPASTWLLDEHRTRQGQSILPGTAYIDLIRSALSMATNGSLGPIELRNLVFMAPLSIADNEKRIVTIELVDADSSDSGTGTQTTFGVSVSSYSRNDRDLLEHASCELVHAADSPIQEIGSAVASKGVEVDGSYEHPLLQFGPRWNCIEAMRTSGAHAHIELSLKQPEDLNNFPVHPALLDMAVGSAQAALGGDELAGSLLPFRYDLIQILAPLEADVSSQVLCTERTKAGVSFDVDVRGTSGNYLVRARGFRLRRIPQQVSPQSGAVGADSSPETANKILEIGFRDGLTNEEGMLAIEHILRVPDFSHVVVATRDLKQLLSATRESSRLTSEEPGVNEETLDTSVPRPELTSVYRAPASEREKSIAELWEETLGISGIGIDDNFFELGGHSLLLTRIVSRLRQRLSLQLALDEVFDRPTIAQWAELSDSQPATEPRKQPALKRVDRSKFRRRHEPTG